MNQQTFTITVTSQNGQLDILAELEKMRQMITDQNDKISRLENEVHFLKKRQTKEAEPEKPKQKPKEEKPIKCLFKKPETPKPIIDEPKQELKKKVKKTESSIVDEKCNRLKLLLG